MDLANAEAEAPVTLLTRRVIDYQKTGDGLDRLIHQISELVYRFPATQNGFSDEDGAEFLLRFLPRITRLIDRYRETGKSFESYLATTLRWQIKSLAADRSGERIQLTALRGPGSELRDAERSRITRTALEVHEPMNPVPSPIHTTAGRCTLLRSAQGRRLIHLSLKMAERLSEADYRRVAAVSGCDPDWLIGCWHALRDGYSEQRERRAAVGERRDRAWFQVRCLQYRLQLVLDDDEREVVNRRLAMWRRRYEHARHVLARMHCGPSHADIARVLGVPKGTVDSSVFYGKREICDSAYRVVLASAISNS
jgi:hypothetical protein